MSNNNPFVLSRLTEAKIKKVDDLSQHLELLHYKTTRLQNYHDNKANQIESKLSENPNMNFIKKAYLENRLKKHNNLSQRYGTIKNHIHKFIIDLKNQ